jgi:hypothetical protein
MNPGGFQNSLALNFLEAILTNYVDMDLAMKGKTLLMDKIFLNVIDAVNPTTTESMKNDLINEINSSITTYFII